MSVQQWHVGVGDMEGTGNMALKERPCSGSVPGSLLSKAARQNDKSRTTPSHTGGA